MINEIPECQSLLSQIKEHKKFLNQHRRSIKAAKAKLSTLNKRFQFLFDIFSPTIGDTELEQKIFLVFKEIGYDNVKHITDDKRNPDIVIDYKNSKTCIEVKNTKNQTIAENDMFQIYKYKQRYQDDFKNLIVKGILILNHENQSLLKDRNENPIDSHRERDAKLNQYSIVTTVELVKAFILIKKNKLTLEQFDKVIHNHGIVKFSKKEIEKCLSAP